MNIIGEGPVEVPEPGSWDRCRACGGELDEEARGVTFLHPVGLLGPICSRCVGILWGFDGDEEEEDDE